MRGIRDRDRRVQEFEDPLGGSHRCLHDIVLFSDIPDGLVHALKVLHERYDDPGEEGRMANQETSVPERDSNRDGAEYLDDGEEHCVIVNPAQENVAVIGIDCVKSFENVLFAAECLDRGNSRNAFLQCGVE